MKKQLKNIALTLSAITSISSHADIFTLSEVRYDTNKAYLFTTNTLANTHNCGDSQPIILKKEDDGFDQMYAMALTAVASGKTMECWIDECSTSAWGNTRPKAYACGLKSN